MNKGPQPEVSAWLSIIERIEKDYDILAPTKLQGVGGVRHQQLQLLIRNHALQLGYGVEIKQQLVAHSRQKVDVGIKGNGIRVACEIPISTKYYEYPNIRKCLDNDYDYVISVALDRKTLNIVSRACEDKLTDKKRARIRFFLPEELIEFLKQFNRTSNASSDRVTEVRGWKVRKLTVRFLLKKEPEEDQSLEKLLHGALFAKCKSDPPKDRLSIRRFFFIKKRRLMPSFLFSL